MGQPQLGPCISLAKKPSRMTVSQLVLGFWLIIKISPFPHQNKYSLGHKNKLGKVFLGRIAVWMKMAFGKLISLYILEKCWQAQRGFSVIANISKQNANKNHNFGDGLKAAYSRWPGHPSKLLPVFDNRSSPYLPRLSYDLHINSNIYL